MTIIIPNGQPNRRFMRYVRPPAKDSGTPLFPLRPGTRETRVGIDLATVSAPPDGYLRDLLTRDEIEVSLLVPVDETVPTAWKDLLPDALVCEICFVSVAHSRAESGGSGWGNSIGVPVRVTSRGELRSRTWGYFHAEFQERDAEDAPKHLPPLTLEERHRAAAYAASASALGIDALVTEKPTAGRSDVADNDVVASVTPDDAVALFGHYLRVTSNPVVEVQRGGLAGGGNWERTQSTGTIVNLYDWGVVSAMPYFDIALIQIARVKGGVETEKALRSIQVRLSRAARALDHMIAALSNPIKEKLGDADVVEAAAEAFDRELLYLAAAFDIYGRLYQALIDPAKDRNKIRSGSLDSQGFLDGHVKPQYDESLLEDVTRLQIYAWVCKQLRNHIHDGILPVDLHPRRGYGNKTNIALNLTSIPELMPDKDSGMTQEHFDALGVWSAGGRPLGAWSPAPYRSWGATTLVADLATTGFALMGAALEYVEAFTKLLLRNKPQQATNPSPFLGCVHAQPGEIEPPPPEQAEFHRAIFGWHPPETS